MSQKLLIICGPTATGKTALGIKIAQQFGGEIVSADSRQVYRGMDIGTGKDLPISSQFIDRSLQLGFANQKIKIGFRKKNQIPIWLVDICEPNYRFNVGEYKKLAYLVVADIWNRRKLPIVVGGTGLYIRSIVEPLDKMSIPPNNKLRKELDKLNVTQLQERLQQEDQEKFETMNQSDRQNPRRLIRAIEVGLRLKHHLHSTTPGESLRTTPGVSLPLTASMTDAGQTDSLLIGLTSPGEELSHRVDVRVEARVGQGITHEIALLLKKGYSWNLPAMSGLGYQEWREYFEALSVKRQASSNLEDLKTKAISQWKMHEKQYTKRQLTWFKKMTQVNWFDVSTPSIRNVIESMVRAWYNNRKPKD